MQSNTIGKIIINDYFIYVVEHIGNKSRFKICTFSAIHVTDYFYYLYEVCYPYQELIEKALHVMLIFHYFNYIKNISEFYYFK